MSVIYINSYQFAAPAGPTDPYFANVSLLLHGDGANGSTTIVDNSPSPKTVTAVGNAQISTAQSKFGGSSLAFDGNGDYLGIADSTDFDIGLSSNPFTIEAWVRPNAFGSLNAVFNKGGGFGGWNGTNGHQYLLFYYNSTDLYFQWWNGSSLSSINSTGALATNVWAFLAVVYDGTDVKVYKDGTLLMTGSSAVFAKPSASNIVRVGGDIAGGGEWNGYIDDLRVTKGIARYTSNFTPPTQPFPDF